MSEDVRQQLSEAGDQAREALVALEYLEDTILELDTCADGFDGLSRDVSRAIWLVKNVNKLVEDVGDAVDLARDLSDKLEEKQKEEVAETTS
jgi:hypothetical protein